MLEENVEALQELAAEILNEEEEVKEAEVGEVSVVELDVLEVPAK